MSDSTDRYGRLTKGGKVTANLTQEEACAVLAAYDDGVGSLSREDLHALDSLLGKLKDQIWA